MAMFTNVLLLACMVACLDHVISASIILTELEIDTPYLDTIKGDFIAKDGYKCHFFEKGGGSGRGPRSLEISCSKLKPQEDKKTNKKKNKPEYFKYQCAYRGNPHHCTWYNKSNNNKPIFYLALVEKLKENASACSASDVEYTAKCPGVKFEKQ